MKYHKIGFTFHFEQEFLPTRRHRKPRCREMVTCRDIMAKELTKDEFPVAMIVEDYATLYRGANSYADIQARDDGSYERVFDELRTCDGRLYKAVRITYGTAVSDVYADPVDEFRDRLNRIDYRNRHWRYTSVNPGTDPIVVSDNMEERLNDLKAEAGRYIICDNKLWEECGEPMYVIQTFGLGHNHGGTGMFVEYFYNPNIGAENYFTALQRGDAIAYANSIAARRGDTKSVGKFGMHEDIKVLMPETVQRNPKADHSDGDPFLNGLEELCENSDSAGEAGILALIYTAANMNAGGAV